jgi:hypothetical protein
MTISARRILTFKPSAVSPLDAAWQTGYRMMAVEVENMDAAVAYLTEKDAGLSRSIKTKSGW